MVETEIAFTNLEEIIKLTERLIKFVISSTLQKNFLELEYLGKYSQKELTSRLQKLLKKDFVQLEYTSAIKILKTNFKEIE
jgi:asparaginyl-tRNA synthetase